MTAPTVKVEITYAGTGIVAHDWEDVTSTIKPTSPIVIRRGRVNEREQAGPATATVTFRNPDGRYTEGTTYNWRGVNPIKWERYARLRIKVNGVSRFTGYITDMSQEWPDGTSASSVVTVTAACLKTILGLSPNVRPWATELIEDLAPVAWWPLDDPEDATSAASAVAGIPAMPVVYSTVGSVDSSYTDGTAKFGDTAPDWLESSAMVTQTPHMDALNAGGFATLSCAYPVGLTPPFTVLLVVQPKFDAQWDAEPVPDTRFILTIPMASFPLSVWHKGRTMGISGTSFPQAVLADGVPRLIGLAVGATTQTLFGVGSTSYALTGLNLAAISLGGNPHAGTSGYAPFSGSFSHLAIIPGTMTANDFADLRRKVEGGYGTDLEWLQQAANYAGISVGVGKAGRTRSIKRPNLKGRNPLEIGEDLADAYGGMLISETREGLTLVDPTYVPTQTPVPVIRLSSNIKWASEAQFRITEAGQNGNVMASRTDWFPKKRLDIDPDLSPVEARHYAQWAVNAADVTSAPRLSGISINMLALADTTDIELLTDLVRPRVRIDETTLPSQIPTGLRTLTVEGTTETIATGLWTLELSTAPDPRFILADPVQGILGADNRLAY